MPITEQDDKEFWANEINHFLEKEARGLYRHEHKTKTFWHLASIVAWKDQQDYFLSFQLKKCRGINLEWIRLLSESLMWRVDYLNVKCRYWLKTCSGISLFDLVVYYEERHCHICDVNLNNAKPRLSRMMVTHFDRLLDDITNFLPEETQPLQDICSFAHPSCIRPECTTSPHLVQSLLRFCNLDGTGVSILIPNQQGRNVLEDMCARSNQTDADRMIIEMLHEQEQRHYRYAWMTLIHLTQKTMLHIPLIPIILHYAFDKHVLLLFVKYEQKPLHLTPL